jgi:hypothetical protein
VLLAPSLQINKTSGVYFPASFFASATMGSAPALGEKAARRAPYFRSLCRAWPDGGKVPLKYAGGRGGENKSPMFVFHWTLRNDPATPPDALKTYAIVFHDIENAGWGDSIVDTLRWFGV